MRKGGVFGLTLVTAVLTVFSFGACDLLNNKPEIDVERAIDGAVAYANAAILPVTVDEGGMGTASPRGTLTGIKQGVPFTLNYSSFAEYGFLRWEAVLASAPGTKLNADKVEFDPVDKPETTVTVKINPGADDRVIIRPVGGLAPTVVSFTPDLAVHGITPPERAIRIRFSRAIDPDSFLFDNGLPFEGDWKDAYYIGNYDGRVYKNILIESNQLVSMENSNNWAPFYHPPELSDDGTILTIPFCRNTGLTSDLTATFNQVTITLNRDIRDTRGISLGRTTSFVMETGGFWLARTSDPDSDPPYPEILQEQNFVMVKASPPDADHPDGRILSGAKIFCREDTADLTPSSEPTHNFSYGDDNWIYIAFQTDLNDYTFDGALIYEKVHVSGTTATYNYDYTGQRAEPVYDPDIVTPLAKRFEEVYSASALGAGYSHLAFNPSRPIRVVRYNLSSRTGSGNSHVYLHIIPLDIWDWTKEGGSDSWTKTDTGVSLPFTNGDLFDASATSTDLGDRIGYSRFIYVWYTD